MHLFYVADFDCRRYSGEAGHVRGIVRALEQRGCEVWLFSSGWTAQPGERIRFFSVPQITVPGAYALSFGLFCPVRVAWALLKRRPSFVLSRYYKFVLPLLWMSRLVRLPVFLEVNADIENERQLAGGGRIRNAFEAWLERMSYACATGIVAVSDTVRGSIQARFPALKVPVAVIPNGVDTAVYHPRDMRLCRSQLGLDTDARCVVFAGTFQKYQGLATLLDAMPLVLQQVPRAVLLLVGDGPMRDAVRHQVGELNLEDRVMFLGRRSEEDTAAAIGAADVCVAPFNLLGASKINVDPAAYGAQYHGSPLKVLTYMACGRPIVASHYREAGARVEQLNAGIAVPPENPEALASALVRLLQNPVLAQEMGDAGAQAVRVAYSWFTTADQVSEFVTSCLPVNR